MRLYVKEILLFLCDAVQQCGIIVDRQLTVTVDIRIDAALRSHHCVCILTEETAEQNRVRDIDHTVTVHIADDLQTGCVLRLFLSLRLGGVLFSSFSA